jgi:acyl-CoA reductase-like NAD-dependent aldehyde dehydrogenase
MAAEGRYRRYSRPPWGDPDGVFTVLNGDKEAVDGLLTHPDVRSVSFVGSTPVARYVYETGTAHGKRVQALGGAKNHMLVLPDADLDLAADSAVNVGFGSAGERCMAIPVVVAVEPVADKLISKITKRIAGLKVSDGRRSCDMGAFGNGTAIFTNDGWAARRFGKEIQVGMIRINVPIPVPVATFSFGGWKDSLFGDTKAHGAEGVRFFTQTKAITTRWPDPSHGGINLGFPRND